MIRSHHPTNLNSIDLFKFLMSIVVVAIHTDPLIQSTNTTLQTITHFLMQLAVPFFFLASGYLLAGKQGSSNLPDSATIIKQLRKILKMYLLWSLIYLPIAAYNFWSDQIPLWKAGIYYIRNFIFIGDQYNSWQLWYLLATVYALIYILVLTRFRVKTGYIILFSALISLLTIAMDNLAAYSGDLPLNLARLKYVISLTTTNGRILKGLIYIPIGMILRQKKIPAPASGFLLALSFAGTFYVTNSFLCNYLYIFASIFLFCFVLGIPLKNHPIYSIFRSLSTDIYLLHMYGWTIYYSVVYGEKTFGSDSFFFTVLFCIIIGIIHIAYKKRASVLRRAEKKESIP